MAPECTSLTSKEAGSGKDDIENVKLSKKLKEIFSNLKNLIKHADGGDAPKDEDPDDLAKETKDLVKPRVAQILRLSKPEWPWLLVGVLCMLLSLMCDLLKVAVYCSALDTIIVSRNKLDDDSQATPTRGMLSMNLVGLSLSQLMYIHLSLECSQHFFSQVGEFLYEITGERATSRVRRDLLRAILSQEIGLFDRRKSGEFVSRLGTDVEALRSAISTQLASFIFNSFKIALACWGTFYMFTSAFEDKPDDNECGFLDKMSNAAGSLLGFENVENCASRFDNATLDGIQVEEVNGTFLMGMMIFACFTLVFTLNWYKTAISKATAEYQDWVAKAASVAQESIGALRTVRSFAAEQYQVNNYTSLVGTPGRCGPCSPYATGSALDVSVQRTWVKTFGEGILKLMGGIFQLSFSYFGFESVSDNSIKPGELIGAMMYSLRALSASAELLDGFSEIAAATGASARIFELINRSPRTAGGTLQPELHGALRFEDVTFEYPTRPDVKILQKLTLDIPQGGTTAIVGESGAGKSTILELIGRFYEVKSGSGCVRFDGHDVLELDPLWLRKHIAMVRQEPVMFGMTIRENIAYARAVAGGPDVSDEEIVAASRQAHAHDFVSAFPEGYDTLVGERGIRLSGGQKQRLALARAIIANPRVLLLDEATSALDATSEVLVQEALARLMVGRTVLMVAHRLSTVRDADQIVMLQSGAVLDVGPHETLLKRCGAYRTLVEKQLEGNDKEEHGGGGGAL